MSQTTDVRARFNPHAVGFLIGMIFVIMVMLALWAIGGPGEKWRVACTLIGAVLVSAGALLQWLGIAKTSIRGKTVEKERTDLGLLMVAIGGLFVAVEPFYRFFIELR